jgi:HK97 family phage prohead protease
MSDNKAVRFWQASHHLLTGPPDMPALLRLWAEQDEDPDKGGLLVLEYKDLPGGDWQHKAGDDADGTVVGYAAAYAKDLGNDVIVPGAFKQTISEASAFASRHGTEAMWPLLWQHDKGDPVGYVASAREDYKGLRCRFVLDRSIEHGRQAYNGLKQGYLSFSIGYKPVKYDWSGSTRNLKEIKLAEVSTVSFPMNPEARVA